jgi:hypothetical protein
MFHRRSCGTSLSQRVINSGAGIGGAGSDAYLSIVYGGAIGPTGMTWDNSVYVDGITGPTGRIGPQQFMVACNIGPTGEIGMAGYDGTADVAGPTGSVGYVGYGGLVGAMGPTGITPTTAPVGAMGATGPAGDAGPYGGYEAIFEAKYTADSILYLPSIANIAPNVIIHATLIGGGGGGGGSFQNYGGSGGGSGYKEVITFITPTVDMSLNIFVGGGGAGGIGYSGVINNFSDVSGTNGKDGSDTYITLFGPNTSNTVVAHAAGGKGATYDGGGNGYAGGGCAGYIDPNDIVLFYNSDATIPIPPGTIVRNISDFAAYQYMDYYIVGGGGGGGAGTSAKDNGGGGGGGSGYQLGYLPTLYDPIEDVYYNSPSSSHPERQPSINLSSMVAAGATTITFVVGKGGANGGTSGAGGDGQPSSITFNTTPSPTVYQALGGSGGGYQNGMRNSPGNGGNGYYGGGGGIGGKTDTATGGLGDIVNNGINGVTSFIQDVYNNVCSGGGAGQKPNSDPSLNGGWGGQCIERYYDSTAGGGGGGGQLYSYGNPQQYPKFGQVNGATAIATGIGTTTHVTNADHGNKYSGQGGGGGAYHYRTYVTPGDGGSGLIVAQFHSAHGAEPHPIAGNGLYSYLNGNCPTTTVTCGLDVIHEAGNGGGVCAGAAGNIGCSPNTIVGGGGGGGFGGGDGGYDTNGHNGSYYGAGGGGASFSLPSNIFDGGMGYEGVAYIKIYNLY